MREPLYTPSSLEEANEGSQREMIPNDNWLPSLKTITEDLVLASRLGLTE